MTTRRSQPRRPLRAHVEALEPRELMADLRGASFSIYNPIGVAPGSTIPVQFAVANDSPYMVGPSFEVAFYLSRDGFVDRSDRLLDTGRFDPFMPPFYVTQQITEFVSLPTADDPFWQGDGTYTIGMIVDSLDEVLEFDESNNANRGLGLDSGAFLSTGLTPSPDLVIENFSPATIPTERGGSITVDFDVRDLRGVGTAGRPVTVAIRLNRGPTSNPGDRELGRVDVGPLGSGAVHGKLTVVLPGRDDPTWIDAPERQYLLAQVDPDAAIAETDESNNGSRGLGVDVAELHVDLTNFDPNALPQSKHKPGTVISQFLAAMSPWIGATIKDYQTYAKTWRGVNLAPQIQALKAIDGQIRTLNNQLQPLTRNPKAVQAFTTTTRLDAEALNWADRFVLAFMTSRTGSGTVSARGGSGGKVHAAADEPWWNGSALKNLIKNWYANNKQGIDDAAAKHRANLAWLTAIVGLLAKGAGVTMFPAGILAALTAAAFGRTYYLQQMGKAADRGDKGSLTELTRVERSTSAGTQTVVMDDNAPKYGATIGPVATTTVKTTRIVIDTRVNGETYADQVIAAVENLKARPGGSSAQGTYVGTYNIDSSAAPTGKQSGKINIAFTSKPGDPVAKGSGYFDHVTYLNGREVSRKPKSIEWSGTLSGGAFMGNVFIDGKSYTFSFNVTGNQMMGGMGLNNLRFTATKK